MIRVKVFLMNYLPMIKVRHTEEEEAVIAAEAITTTVTTETIAMKAEADTEEAEEEEGDLIQTPITEEVEVDFMIQASTETIEILGAEVVKTTAIAIAMAMAIIMDVGEIMMEIAAGGVEKMMRIRKMYDSTSTSTSIHQVIHFN
jgi:hypothetical protein